jgi:hypothetical protein
VRPLLLQVLWQPAGVQNWRALTMLQKTDLPPRLALAPQSLQRPHEQPHADDAHVPLEQLGSSPALAETFDAAIADESRSRSL